MRFLARLRNWEFRQLYLGLIGWHMAMAVWQRLTGCPEEVVTSLPCYPAQRLAKATMTIDSILMVGWLIFQPDHTVTRHFLGQPLMRTNICDIHLHIQKHIYLYRETPNPFLVVIVAQSPVIPKKSHGRQKVQSY